MNPGGIYFFWWRFSEFSIFLVRGVLGLEISSITESCESPNLVLSFCVCWFAFTMPFLSGSANTRSPLLSLQYSPSHTFACIQWWRTLAGVGVLWGIFSLDPLHTLRTHGQGTLTTLQSPASPLTFLEPWVIEGRGGGFVLLLSRIINSMRAP